MMLYQTVFKGFAALVLSLLSLNLPVLAQKTPAPAEATPPSVEATPTPTETTPAPAEATPPSVEATPIPAEATPIPAEATPPPSETPAPTEIPTPMRTPIPQQAAPTEIPTPNNTERPLPNPPQVCEPLALIGGEGSEVTKTVSAPTLPIPIPVPVPLPIPREVRNNWNTDWAVRGGQAYRKYVVTFTPLSNGKFDIKMYLKYSDNTNESFYSKDRIDLNQNEPFTVEAVPRPNDQPYQVNVMVGGVTSIGERYRVAVAGCR